MIEWTILAFMLGAIFAILVIGATLGVASCVERSKTKALPIATGWLIQDLERQRKDKNQDRPKYQ
jgi:hypothetical protein